MTDVLKITNKQDIAEFLKQNAPLYIYLLGDLDDMYWDDTEWLAIYSQDRIKDMILVYKAFDIPTVIHLSNSLTKAEFELLAKLLPGKFYAHLNPSYPEIYSEYFQTDHSSQHLKMTLTKDSYIAPINAANFVRELSVKDLGIINTLYEEAYPENWFDSHMLEIHPFYGIIQEDKLVSIAGIHVFSEMYEVAAIGSVTTHPDYRSKGYSKLCMGKLISKLFEKVAIIGLNVSRENIPAISMYKKLGFKITSEYVEATMSRFRC